MVRLLFLRPLVLVCALALAAVAHPLTATFDSFAEGALGTSFVDGGIAFSALRYESTGSDGVFTADEATATLGGFSGFSSPNVLNFGGLAVGAAAGRGKFYSMDFRGTGLSSSASLNVFTNVSGSGSGSAVILQGLLNGSVVATSRRVFGPGPDTTREFVSLASGRYDSFRLLADGTRNGGSVFIDVDDVVVAPVPEPASVIALGLGALAALRRRSRQGRSVPQAESALRPM